MALRREVQLLTSAAGQAPSLGEFLDGAGVELDDVGEAGGWVKLRRAAGVEGRPSAPSEDVLARGVRRRYHLDDADRLDRLQTWLAAPSPPTVPELADRRLLRMALVTRLGLKRAPDTLDEALASLWEPARVLDELRETLPLLRERVGRVSQSLPDDGVPLRLAMASAQAVWEATSATPARSRSRWAPQMA